MKKSKGDFRGTFGLNLVIIPDQKLGDPKWLEVIFWPEKSPDFSYSQKSISNYLKFKHYKSMESWLQVIFRFFFPPWEIQLHIQMCRIDYLGKEFAFLNFQTINQFHEKKEIEIEYRHGVWGMSVLLDELVRHLSISTKKGIANFVNAELAQRNCQTDQFFKLWERHFSKFQKLC